MTPFQSTVYGIVRAIPPGRVLSYGAVAAIAGVPRAARGVGSAMAALDDGNDVPWWRVVNRNGEITTPRLFHLAHVQRRLLQDEGVPFTQGGRVDMDLAAWDPLPSEPR